MKEQFMDVNLQHLTLKSLLSALSGNLRGQNHFKSIGGLEVLLDGLGLPTNNVYNLKNIYNIIDKRYIYLVAVLLLRYVLWVHFDIVEKMFYLLLQALVGDYNPNFTH